MKWYKLYYNYKRICITPFQKMSERFPLEPPLRILVGYCKANARIVVMLGKNRKMHIEGTLLGFDEFMNLVLDDAIEFYMKTGTTVPLGKILLRGETIGYIYEKPETKYVVDK